mgnify:CR=1 FL=1
MKKYIVVLSNNCIVTHSIEVTGKSERQIERIENGLNINLNHELYYTRIVDEIAFNDLAGYTNENSLKES